MSPLAIDAFFASHRLIGMSLNQTKPTKFTIAVVLINPENSSEILAVKRPADDDSLPNVWGLPAVIVKEGELPEDAVKRLGFEKLATEIEPMSYVGIKRAERDTHELILMDIQAKLKGKQPSVKDGITTGTKYVDQRWTRDYSIFTEAANNGSLCSRILLESKGLTWGE